MGRLGNAGVRGMGEGASPEAFKGEGEKVEERVVTRREDIVCLEREARIQRGTEGFSNAS